MNPISAMTEAIADEYATVFGRKLTTQIAQRFALRAAEAFRVELEKELQAACLAEHRRYGRTA